MGIIFFLSEIRILNNTKKHYNRLILLDSLNKKKQEGEKKVDLESLRHKDEGVIFFIFTGIFYLAWMIIGALFAGQWILFTGLLVFGFFTGFYRRRFCNNQTTKSIRLLKFDAFLSSIWISFIILNHFHHIL
jgi:hypothetical protein